MGILKIGALGMDLQFKFPNFNAGCWTDGSFLRDGRTHFCRWGTSPSRHDVSARHDRSQCSSYKHVFQVLLLRGSCPWYGPWSRTCKLEVFRGLGICLGSDQATGSEGSV